MKFEDEAKLIVEAVAKTATSKRTRKLARDVGGRVATGVKSLGIRVFSEVVDRLGDDKSDSINRTKPYRAKPVSAQEAALKFNSAQTSPTRDSTATNASHAPSPEGDEKDELCDPDANTASAQDVQMPRSTGCTDAAGPSKNRYGIDRVVLLVRHPDRAFAYWEIDEQRVDKEATGRLELLDANRDEVLDHVQVDPVQGRHYFMLKDPQLRYIVQLKCLGTDQDWVLLSRSHPGQYDPENPTGSQPPTKNE